MLRDEPDIVIGSREQLFYLLAEAAEIEHTLMCSYLYAALSLKPTTASGLLEPEAEAIERWRTTIRGVAIEEMGHLLMVSNLIVAIGGRPHFTRPNFPVSPGYFPSGVVLRLTPFSLETLEHFIFLERPTEVERADGEGFERSDHERTQAHRGLMPSAQDYGTVSHLYEAIRTNLVAFVDRAGPDALFVAGSVQIGPDLVRYRHRAIIAGRGESLWSTLNRAKFSRTGRRPIPGAFRDQERLCASWRTTLICACLSVAANPVMLRPPGRKGSLHQRPARRHAA